MGVGKGNRIGIGIELGIAIEIGIGGMLTIKVGSKNRSRVSKSASVCSMVFHLTLSWGKHSSYNSNCNCSSSSCHTIQFKYADWVRKFGCSSTRAQLSQQATAGVGLGAMRGAWTKLMCRSSWEEEEEDLVLVLLLLLRRVFNWLWLWLFSYSFFGAPLCQSPVLPRCCYCCNCVLAINFVYWWVSCAMRASETAGNHTCDIA